MTTQPVKIGEIPALLIDNPVTYTAVAGNLVSVTGFEFGDAVAIRITSAVPFHFSLALLDVDGAALSLLDASRGWRPAGAHLIGFFAEERKLFIRAAGNGLISIERLQAFSAVAYT